MLPRRRLLAGALAVLPGAALAGCTQPAPVVWLPWQSPSPLPVTDAEGGARRCAELAATARAILDRGQALKVTARQRRQLTWLADTAALHSAVLASADPARRQPGTTPSVPAVAPPATSAAAWSLLTGRLRAAGEEFLRRSLATTGAPALLWGALGAFASAGAAGLPSSGFTGGTDEARTTPELSSGDWLEPMLARSREAGFGLEQTLATPRLSKANRRVVLGQLSAWEVLQQELIAALRAAGRPVPPVPAAYDVPVPADQAHAWQLGARIQSTVLPQLGAWLANASDPAERALAAGQLQASARGIVAFGGTLPRWPGWSG